ncbi:hypothetical protein [Nocardiopsis algeriensis]|uniref:Uncharacterized protein n=1 Tax=Nocardiopsis algeriensis TaxID=1478215 RepID=A0A841IJR7_9ACTN|nr:hypothetical protein [Nocardiopsis algeriensis]MBB6119009.1 hypothetical protein [Nocardiopsis algeriensis]
MLKKIPGVIAILMALALLGSMPQAHATHVLPAATVEDYYVEINGVEYRPSQERSQTWAACGARDDSHKLVRTFTKNGGPSGKSAYLKCGSQGWGYRHIKDRHMDDWNNIAAQIGDNWRSFADFAIEQILIAPESVSYRAGNDTYAFTAPVQIRDGDGNVVRTYRPVVSVANESRNIITAYPRRG